MADRLPPLTALRAFDAAARHMSFAKAAEELNVTPAALSYQIKSLEADLGTPVFRRLNRAVELTEAGRALAPGLKDAFATLGAAWRNTQRLQDNGVLTVTAGPAFTAKWLAPRMFEFTQAHPEVELRFLATLRLVDFDRDEVDLAIRFGMGTETGLYMRDLNEEWMTPMMRPSMAAEFPTPADLIKADLIHEDSLLAFDTPMGWGAWAQAAGVTLDTDHGPRFSQADHALDAAISGAGVVLGRVSLASRALDSGRLVAPYDIGLIAAPRFRLMCPEGHETRPHIAAFEAWVMAEVAAARAYRDGRRMIDARLLAA